MMDSKGNLSNLRDILIVLLELMKLKRITMKGPKSKRTGPDVLSSMPYLGTTWYLENDSPEWVN